MYLMCLYTLNAKCQSRLSKLKVHEFQCGFLLWSFVHYVTASISQKVKLLLLKLIYQQTVLYWEPYFFEYRGIDLLARLRRALISQNYVSILKGF